MTKKKTMFMEQAQGGGGNLLDSLISYYDFEKDGYDLVGSNNLTQYGNGGILFNATGKSGNCAHFPNINGSAIYEPTDDESLVFTDGAGTDKPFSFSCFWKPLDTSNTFLISKRSGGSEYQIFVFNGYMYFSVYSAGSSNVYQTANRQGSPVVDTWEHIVWTYDGSGSNTGMHLYFNGVEDTSYNSSGTYNGMNNTTTPFMVGNSQWDENYGANAHMDGLAIWDRVLTQSEVTSIYNTQNGGDELVVRGTEVISNGNFDTDLTSWAQAGGRGTYSVDVGRLKIVNDLASSNPFVSQQRAITYGETYRFRCDVKVGTATNILVRIDGNSNIDTTTTVDKIIDFEFVCDATNTTIQLFMLEGGNTGNYCYFDNVSLIRVS